jgi:hypothetical protein
MAGPLWTGVPVVHGPVDQVYGYFLYEINLLNQYFQEFCKEAPVFFCNQPAVHGLYGFLQLGPWFSNSIYRLALGLQFYT